MYACQESLRSYSSIYNHYNYVYMYTYLFVLAGSSNAAIAGGAGGGGGVAFVYGTGVIFNGVVAVCKRACKSLHDTSSKWFVSICVHVYIKIASPCKCPPPPPVFCTVNSTCPRALTRDSTVHVLCGQQKKR